MSVRLGEGRAIAALGVAALSLFGSGCKVDAGGYDESSFRCLRTGECPDGQVCRADGYCAAAGAAIDGGDLDDAGGPDAPGCTPGGASQFQDDFEDGTPGPGWAAVNTCVSEAGGELVLAPAPNTPNDYCWYGTTSYHDLTCDSITVKVPETTTAALGPQTFVRFRPSGGGELHFLLENGEWQVDPASGAFQPFARGYDPLQDLWWRFTYFGGVLEFATSPDGAAWEVLSAADPTVELDEFKLDLGAGTYNVQANPGRAVFDCFNVEPPCP